MPCQSTCDSPLTLCRLACSSGCGCPENKFLDTKANACVVPKDCPQQCEHLSMNYHNVPNFKVYIKFSLKDCWDGQYYASGESWRCSDGCNAWLVRSYVKDLTINHILLCYLFYMPLPYLDFIFVV